MAIPTLDNLRRLGQLPAKNVVFSCGDNVPVPNDEVVLAYRPTTARGSPMNSIGFPGSSVEDLQVLQTACTPSTFGRGNQAVLDPTYRLAAELPASRFLTSFELAATPILEQVRAILMPEATAIHATMYKLNVYGPGGFFKAHQDTPRRADMFGTLVVCLPTEFTGGDFVVRHHAFSETFSWATAQDTAPTLQWCAFYADCEHEILPVVTGTRVTITFNLETWTTPVIKDLAVHSAFADQLAAALRDPTFAPDGTTLGFALAHEYPVDGSSDVPLVKGMDRALACALTHAGLEYVFVPVYKSDSYEASTFPRLEPGKERYHRAYDNVLEWSNPKWPEPDPEEGSVWAGDGDLSLYVSDWESYDTMMDYPDENDDDCMPPFASLNLRTATSVVWIVPPRAFPYTKYGAWYGNEPTMAAFYMAACFLVRVPPAAQRQARH